MGRREAIERGAEGNAPSEPRERLADGGAGACWGMLGWGPTAIEPQTCTIEPTDLPVSRSAHLFLRPYGSDRRPLGSFSTCLSSILDSS